MKFKSLLLLIIISVLFAGCDNKSKITNNVFSEHIVNEMENYDQNEQNQTVNINLKTFEGQDLNLSIANQKWNFQDINNKIIILNFFGTWCPPCKKEIPSLVNMKNEFNNDVEIIGMDIGKKDGSKNIQKELLEFIKHFNINYKITAGQINNELFSELTSINPNGTIPFTMLFDKNGNFIKPYSGLVYEEELKKDINKILEKI